ncbi:MAG: hypothetical protein KAS39_01360, partial [Actinomycetia bacterium]|nr:hypothetical protein [Actinomycetes bacterium]
MNNFLNIFSLSGKIAAITGGAGILGRQISQDLGRAGARVAICDIADTTSLIDKLKEEGIENPTPQQIQEKQSQLMEEGREVVDQASMEATSAQNKITELEAERNKLKEEGDELIKTVENLKEEGKYDEAEEFFD